MQKPKHNLKNKDLTYNSSDKILMIRPSNFGSNPQTLADNAFQSSNTDKNQQVKQIALNQFDYFVATLKKQGINVITVQDIQEPAKPDAIFPNNWFGTLRDGRVVIYPMKPVSRRLQKKNPVIENLKKLDYEIKSIVDLSKYEQQENEQSKTGVGKFLQGTGSMIFDHQNKIAYACKSQRTNQQLFLKFCQQIIKYRPIFFQSFDAKDKPYYHTNVIMSVCSDFVIICLQSITNQQQKSQILIAIKQSQASDKNKKKQLIDITRQQVNKYCGNVLQVHNEAGDKFLVMSASAYDGFTQEQIQAIQKYCKIIKVDIPCIQTYGGGGTRCTMAEIYLKKKSEHKNDGKDKEVHDHAHAHDHTHENKEHKQVKQAQKGKESKQVKETKQIEGNKQSKDKKQVHHNTEVKQTKDKRTE